MTPIPPGSALPDASASAAPAPPLADAASPPAAPEAAAAPAAAPAATDPGGADAAPSDAAPNDTAPNDATQNDTGTNASATNDPDPTAADGWQRLPARAIPLCTIDISLSLAVVFAIAATIVGVLAVGRGSALISGLAGALFGAGVGMWIGFRRYRNTLWRLDAHGFAVRRGVAWQRETIVPLTRVQHLDLKHGPLQRMRRLATLVVHTAGTRHSSVAIDHLDADDAQRLRERLGRQLDLEDDEAR